MQQFLIYTTRLTAGQVDDHNLHQTGVLLELLLEPGELAVAPPHARRFGSEGLTVGLTVEEEQSDTPKHYVTVSVRSWN